MEILEFGNKKKEKIILIHGFECVWQVFEKIIDDLKNDYHLIVPILPGHNPNKKEEFYSYQKTAKEIEDYFLLRYPLKVKAIYGHSMGGIIATILWQNKLFKIDYLFLDGTPLVGYGKIMQKYLTNFYLKMTHKTQRRDEKTLMQAEKQIIPLNKKEDFLQMMDKISDRSITNYIKQTSKFKFNKNIRTDTKITYFHGTQLNEKLAKKSAKLLKKYYPKTNVVVFEGKSHSEVLLKEADVMLGHIKDIIDNI